MTVRISIAQIKDVLIVAFGLIAHAIDYGIIPINVSTSVYFQVGIILKEADVAKVRGGVIKVQIF